MGPGKDLGFSYHVRKSGEIVISRRGTQVTILRGKSAAQFLSRLTHQDPQHVMARATGNYKRVNEG